MKDAATASYSKKGEAIVKMNHDAIDAGCQQVVEVKVPESWKNAKDSKMGMAKVKVAGNKTLQDFVNNIVVAHQKGIDISDTLRAEVDHINAIRKARIRSNTSELEAKLVLPMAVFCFLPMMCLAVLPPMIAALEMF